MFTSTACCIYKLLCQWLCTLTRSTTPLAATRRATCTRDVPFVAVGGWSCLQVSPGSYSNPYTHREDAALGALRSPASDTWLHGWGTPDAGPVLPVTAFCSRCVAGPVLQPHRLSLLCPQVRPRELAPASTGAAAFCCTTSPSPAHLPAAS